jgi:hypothetical protein
MNSPLPDDLINALNEEIPAAIPRHITRPGATPHTPVGRRRDRARPLI